MSGEDKRLMDLEQRLRALEEQHRASLWSDAAMARDRETQMVLLYGEAVEQRVAAKILGRSRGTILNMLRDGRLRSACDGSMVDVRSIAAYVEAPQRADMQARERKHAGKAASQRFKVV